MVLPVRNTNAVSSNPLRCGNCAFKSNCTALKCVPQSHLPPRIVCLSLSYKVIVPILNHGFEDSVLKSPSPITITSDSEELDKSFTLLPVIMTGFMLLLVLIVSDVDEYGCLCLTQNKRSVDIHSPSWSNHRAVVFRMKIILLLLA